MKLNYQILKQLILEQLETNKEITQLRDHFYSGNLAAAYDIYKRALENPRSETSILIKDYYEHHIKEKIASLQREALENPKVFVTLRGHKSDYDDKGHYFQFNIWTFSPSSRYKMGIYLGTLKVYTEHDDQISGNFLGEDFRSETTDEDFQVRSGSHGAGDVDAKNWLTGELDEWIRGKGREQYVKFILNAGYDTASPVPHS